MSNKFLCIGCCALLCSAFTCSTIKDNPNRKRQIKNTANSLGQYSFLRQLEATKATIAHLYHEMQDLQDSLDAALYSVSTILNLEIAGIDQELEELQNLWVPLQDYDQENPYYFLLQDLQHQQSNPVDFGKHLTDLLYRQQMTGALPTDYDAFKQLEKNNKAITEALQDIIKKRSITANLIYRQWSDRYREKSLQLNQLLHFTITDFERIQLQKLAQRYMVMSWEMKEWNGNNNIN